ncbi:MAG: hypothetical protein H7Y01_01030, partial [Ferruginibacter sp.]|nr:hypothetical protein [Chitinophagaceae bacterium]
NNHTRNIVIGSIATIIASTTVYYLTQYVNNKKSDSVPNHVVMKEATTNAWKRYVTVDNIYYNAVTELANDNLPGTDPDKYMEEVSKEAGIYKKDAAKIAGEKNIDAALETMLNRRIDRMTEYIDMLSSLIVKIKQIVASTPDKAEQKKKVEAALIPVLGSMRRLFEKAANEIEELAKTLSETYAVTFDPKEVDMYLDYRRNVSGPNRIPDGGNDSPQIARNNTGAAIKAESLVGNWDDNGNKINLLQDNKFNYSLVIGDKATGSWKIENGKLRLDAVSTVTWQKAVLFFTIENVTANSFTMTNTVKPYDRFNAVRVKDN